VIRVSCGSAAGLLDHQAAGEPPCGTCAYAEGVRRISAEGIPARPTPAGWLPPVTPDQAVMNAALLEAALESLENEKNQQVMTLRAQRARAKAAGAAGRGSKVA
jgi:hypothetical protein